MWSSTAIASISGWTARSAVNLCSISINRIAVFKNSCVVATQRPCPDCPSAHSPISCANPSREWKEEYSQIKKI
ncbi:MAG: hypothetical protein V7K27_10115 [Nostoc sp.]|uniref:hypothetical protein n=1 Tax=Nostoc sp. TaxID=1180 RepID=UPI002FF9EED9